MNTEPESRHALLTRLFNAASELPGELRAAFLERSCAGDAALRAELEELLDGEGQRLPLLDDADTPQRKGGLLGMLVSADERWIGSDIGDCRIVEFLGAGGMGAVFRGRQSNPPRDVAVKIVRSGSFDEAALRRFEVETQLLAHLHHPGIAKVHSAGVHVQGPLRIPYCVLELIEGGRPITLFAEDRQLDVRGRLRLFLQACDALQHAHENRVVHRDVKPENLLVDGGGHVRVIDFGIARALTAERPSSVRTRTGHMLGTPAYMSPEQLAARPDELDTRADVYSLGVVLYELLAGRLPIEVDGASLVEISRRILEDEPARLSTIRKSLRGDLETIVAKALSKDPARRYGSAGGLAADLRRYLSDEPITARPATAMYQLTKFARRHRGLVSGATIALVALCAGAGLALWSAIDAIAARDAARRLAYEASLSAAAGAIDAFEFETARRRLDAAPPELRGWEWRYFFARLDDTSLAIAPAGAPWPPLGPRDLRFVELDGQPQLALAYIVAQDGRERILLRRHSPFDGSLSAEFDLGPFEGPWVMLDGSSAWCTSSTGELRRHRISDGGLMGAPLRFASAPSTSRFSVTPIDASRCLIVQRLGTLRLIAEVGLGTSVEVRRLDPSEPSTYLHGPTADGRALVTFGRQISITPIDEREPRAALDYSGEPVLAFAAHPDGERYFAACQDGGLLVFRSGAGAIQLERRVEAHPDAVTAVTVSPSGELVATAGNDRAVRVWHCGALTLLSTLAGADAAPSRLQFSADGRRLAASVGARGTLVFDEPHQSDPRVLRGPGSYVYAVALSPDGALIASGDWDGSVRLWDRHSGEPVARWLLSAEVRPVQTLDWSADGSKLLICVVNASLGSMLYLIDVATGTVAWSARSHQGGLTFAAEWLDAERFAVATDSGIEVHRASDGEWIGDFAAERPRAEALPWSLRWELALAPDGTRLAATLPDGTVELWSVGELRRLHSLRAHSGPAHAVCWSPDGRLVATAGNDRRVCVFEALSGERVAELSGHPSAVYSVCFAADGARLFSGADDDTIRVWDTRAWSELARLTGHTDYVFGLACSQDGQLVSASGDRTLRLWDDRPRARLLADRHARQALVAELAPRIDAWLAEGGATLARERLSSAVELTPRAREVGVQLVLGRAAEYR